jgi:hypothetical protein
VVPGPGRLDPLLTEHPAPANQLIEDTVADIKIISTAGAVGEGGE